MDGGQQVVIGERGERVVEWGRPCLAMLNLPSLLDGCHDELIGEEQDHVLFKWGWATSRKDIS